MQSNYSYTDVNVASLDIPILYYRLKQTDKDGKYSYSNVVALQLPVAISGPIVRVYPNPFKRSLNVMIANTAEIGSNDYVELYTPDGRVVYQRRIGRRNANTTISLDDLPELAQGTYIINLTLNRQKFSFKVVKQ